MRVSVFDPHPVVHKALTSLLPGNGFSVVSQSGDGRDALKTVRTAKPDIVITDVRMPYVDGLKVLELLLDAGVKVHSLVYTADKNPTFVARAIAHGAKDYVLKTGPVENLITALNHIATGSSSIAESQFMSIRAKMRSRDIDHENPHALTNREMQVLRHLGFGLSNREIAMSLEISVETVKEHVQNILRKLDSKDRTAAAVWAVRDGLS